MNQSRRSLLRSLGVGSVAVLSAGFAGCLSNDNENNEPDPGGLTIPNPVIEETNTPGPEIVWTDHEEHSDTTDKYTIELTNNGVVGESVVEFYWMEEENGGDEESSDVGMTLASSERIHLENEEFTTLTFEEDRPDQYDGFWFFVAPITVSVRIKNNGGDGDVVVTLYDGDIVTDETTISMVADEEQIVTLEREEIVSEVEFDVSARPADN